MLHAPATQGRSWVVRTGGAARRAAVKLQRRLRDNERLVVVAVSSMLMSVSHTALRPVLPLFAKVLVCPWLHLVFQKQRHVVLTAGVHRHTTLRPVLPPALFTRAQQVSVPYSAVPDRSRILIAKPCSGQHLWHLDCTSLSGIRMSVLS